MAQRGSLGTLSRYVSRPLDANKNLERAEIRHVLKGALTALYEVRTARTVRAHGEHAAGFRHSAGGAE